MKLCSRSFFLSRFIIQIICLFGVVGFISQGLSVAETPLQKIKLGVSTPLTGEAATYGLDIKDFLIFANRHLSQNRYELIFEDDKCTGKDAVTAAQKLVKVDKVQAVIGFACSAATLTAAPIYENAQVPVMVTFASSPKIKQAGDYIFRSYPNDDDSGKILFSYVKTHHKTFAVLSEETQYAQDLKNVFTGSNTDAALTLVTEDFLPGTVDFRSVLLKLKGKNPEGLFINTQAEHAFGVILQQIKEMNWKVSLYGAYWPASPALLAQAGENLNGIVFVDTPSLRDILNEEGARVYEDYTKGGGKIRSTEAAFATAYEGFRALHLAFQSKGHIKDYLYQTKFKGIFGPYSFDQSGEIQGLSLILKTIDQGVAKPLNNQ